MKIFKLVTWLFFLALPLSVFAEDIDIFTKDPTITSGNPNVLLILDNTSNWSATLDGPTNFEREIEALQNVVETLDANINLGLMMIQEAGTGGYVRYGVRPMTDYNKKALQEVLENMDINDDKTASSNAVYGKAMFEAYKYFGGGGTSANSIPSPQGPTGHGPQLYQGGDPSTNKIDDKRSFPLNPFFLTHLPPQTALGSALSSQAAASYETLITESCAKNFIILLSNGTPTRNSENEMASILTGLGGDATPIALNDGKAQSSFADEMARFLSSKDVSPESGEQNINTYTLMVYKAGDESKPATAGGIELMQSTAREGNGEYFAATDSEELAKGLEAIFSQIQAVDSVFASVTLPVSVNVRGTHLNQVYMGVFRPNDNDKARWLGNLKQYKIAESAAKGIFLADVNGNAVQNPATGFVKDNAESFWTASSSFWENIPRGEPESGSDLPDGPLVEKGGAAQQMRAEFFSSQNGRNVLTNNMTSFDNGSINTASASVQAKFGVSSKAELETLINWVRGEDNKEDENRNSSFTDVRASIHGDVLHSQPAVINYSGNSDDVIVFYGSNDGTLRAVQGGQGANGGKELWAYVAEEFYPRLKKLRDNDVTRSATDPKPYFFDGPITQYQYNGKRYIFVTARRGGRLIYAFDITNPVSPSLLWKKTNADIPGLGETWSSPQTAVIKVGSSAVPVIAMGGGYDANQDNDSPGSDTMGRGIILLHMETGKVVAEFGPDSSLSGGGVYIREPDMKYSIPATVSIFDSNHDGYDDRIYVGDTGGQVWRADISKTDLNDWKVYKIASLGIAAPFSTSDDLRKFLYAPDVVESKDETGTYYAVLLGSGDREKPFEDDVENHFYLIKDRSGLLYNGNSTLRLGDLYDATDNLIQSGSDQEKVAAKTGLLIGGYFRLRSGEKVTTKAVTISGYSYFNTNQPSASVPGSCNANLGEARRYVIEYETLGVPGYNASPQLERSELLDGGGYPPTPTAIRVLGKEVVCSGVNCQEAQGSKLDDRFRVFWHELFE